MEAEVAEFQISQLKLCNRKRHAYQVKPAPNTHLRGRPKKAGQNNLAKLSTAHGTEKLVQTH